MAHLTLSVFASPRLRPKRRVGCSDRDSASSLWRGGERSRWASFVAFLSAASVLSEASLLQSSSAARLAAIAGSRFAMPAVNQSGFCLPLLPEASMAEL